MLNFVKASVTTTASSLGGYWFDLLRTLCSWKHKWSVYFYPSDFYRELFHQWRTRHRYQREKMVKSWKVKTKGLLTLLWVFQSRQICLKFLSCYHKQRFEIDECRDVGKGSVKLAIVAGKIEKPAEFGRSLRHNYVPNCIGLCCIKSSCRPTVIWLRMTISGLENMARRHMKVSSSLQLLEMPACFYPEKSVQSWK